MGINNVKALKLQALDWEIYFGKYCPLLEKLISENARLGLKCLLNLSLLSKFPGSNSEVV